jgi:hypothetical protein
MKHTIEVIAVFGASIIGLLLFWHWRQTKNAIAAQNALGVDPSTLPTVPQGTPYTALDNLNPGVYAQNEEYGSGGLANYDLATTLQSVQAQLGQTVGNTIQTPASVSPSSTPTVTPGGQTAPQAGTTPFYTAGVPITSTASPSLQMILSGAGDTIVPNAPSTTTIQ